MASKITKVIIILALVASLLLILLSFFFSGYRYVRSQDENYREMNERAEENGGNYITEDTAGAKAIFIPRSSDADDIAKLLQEEGFISNPIIFKVMSKFNGFNDKYQAGTHYLLPGMSYDEIMFTLTRQPKPVKITFLEGETYTQMRQKMLDNGLNIDVYRLDNMVRYPNQFLDYDFVRAIEPNENREWLLQGYLWPDTYLFDPNIDEENIIRMFLDNTEQKLAAGEYMQKAAQYNMSIDQVMTLASIIQKEGNIEEMSKIGRVFLNRVNSQMPLESCATINYLRVEEGLEPIPWAMAEDLKKFALNPYNTYAFPDLPPGPINSPGTLAVEGILWPANEDSWPGASQFLYFCSTGEGNNAFASTLAEHEANIAHYSSQWLAGEAGAEGEE